MKISDLSYIAIVHKLNLRSSAFIWQTVNQTDQAPEPPVIE